MGVTKQEATLTESYIAIPDTHIPYHDKRSVDAVFKYIEATRPHVGIVHLGDLVSLDQISSHNKENLIAKTATSVMKDYAAMRNFFDQLADAAGTDNIYYIEGNHEIRAHRFVEQHPQLRGMIEVENNIPTYVKYIPYSTKGKVLTLGKLAFGHGLYVNEHHAKRHAIAYCRNFVYGHTHDVQTYSLERHGHDDTIMATSLGCLCRYDQSYMKGRPSKWQQAFGHVHIQKNGNFNLYIPRIFNHRFVGPDGKEYAG